MSDELHKYPGNLKHHKVAPLLSDADLGYVKDTHTPEQVRDIYEAARAKDAELIQRLVDAGNAMREAIKEHMDDHVLDNFTPYRTEIDMNKAAEVWAAAVAGYKPSEQ